MLRDFVATAEAEKIIFPRSAKGFSLNIDQALSDVNRANSISLPATVLVCEAQAKCAKYSLDADLEPLQVALNKLGSLANSFASRLEKSGKTELAKSLRSQSVRFTQETGALMQQLPKGRVLCASLS